MTLLQQIINKIIGVNITYFLQYYIIRSYCITKLQRMAINRMNLFLSMLR